MPSKNILSVVWIATFTMIVLKLTGNTTLSWLWVFSPVWVFGCGVLGMLFIIFMTALLVK